MKFIKFLLVVFVAVMFAVSCEETKEVVSVTGIEIAPKESVLLLNETLELTVTVLPENATDQTYDLLIDKPEIVSVENGVVTALSVGTANITAITTDGGKTATAKIVVKEPEVVIEPVVLALDTVSVSYSDIVVRVDAPDTARYWIWCELKSDVEDFEKEDFLKHDQNQMDMLKAVEEQKAGKHLTMEEVIDVITKVGALEISMSELIDSDIFAESEYLVWAYGVDEKGKIVKGSEIYTVEVLTDVDPATIDPGTEKDPDEGENPDDGEEPGNGGNEGNEEPEKPANSFSSNDFSGTYEATSTTITLNIVPSNAGTPYYAYCLPESDFQKDGWFYRMSDAAIVQEILQSEAFENIVEFIFTGEQTVEYVNKKPGTAYRFLLFRGGTTLEGDMTKFRVTTLSE